MRAGGAARAGVIRKEEWQVAMPRKLHQHRTLELDVVSDHQGRRCILVNWCLCVRHRSRPAKLP